jgi:hypothetical protein
MPDIDDDELEEIADQLQVGDRAEGAQALRRLVERSAGNRDISSEVRGVLQKDKVRHEIATGLDTFSRKYPQIANDPVLADAGFTVIREEIVKDLKGMGVPDDAIEPLRRSRNTEAIVQAYAEVRAKAPNRVRSPTELLDAAGEDLRRRFNIKGVSARTPQQVIHEMRADRGFSNDDAHIPAARAPQSAADEARSNRARSYLDKRVAAYDRVRNGIHDQDAY